jgi:hypothetical protein
VGIGKFYAFNLQKVFHFASITKVLEIAAHKIMTNMDNFDDDDDEDFGFNDEDFNSEESRREFQRENERVDNLPIMKKAREIFDIVDSLVELIDDDDAFIAHYRSMLFEDASIICAKIAGAEGGDLYSLRMENAVLIKIHARNLLAQTSGLKMLGFKDVRYLQVLRDAIEEFRLLFLEWVEGFDKTNDMSDNWGNLFR